MAASATPAYPAAPAPAATAIHHASPYRPSPTRRPRPHASEMAGAAATAGAPPAKRRRVRSDAELLRSLQQLQDFARCSKEEAIWAFQQASGDEAVARDLLAAAAANEMSVLELRPEMVPAERKDVVWFPEEDEVLRRLAEGAGSEWDVAELLQTHSASALTDRSNFLNISIPAHWLS